MLRDYRSADIHGLGPRSGPMDWRPLRPLLHGTDKAQIRFLVKASPKQPRKVKESTAFKSPRPPVASHSDGPIPPLLKGGT